MSASLFLRPEKPWEGALPPWERALPPLGERASPPGREGFQPSKLSPGQDALDEGWTPWLAETPAFGNFLSLKY